MARTPRMTKPPAPDLRLAVRQRVIYADTDQMGFVYHGTYPRFLEAARVEFMRGLGHTYARVEAKGLGMPLTDLAPAPRPSSAGSSGRAPSRRR